jgi:hypothetical protein
MATCTQCQRQLDYMDVLETATKALNSLYADLHQKHDPADVEMKANEFASVLIEVFNRDNDGSEEAETATVS